MKDFTALEKTFTDASLAIVAELKANGPRWMSGTGGKNWVFVLDGSAIGFQILVANPAVPVEPTATT